MQAVWRRDRLRPDRVNQTAPGLAQDAILRRQTLWRSSTLSDVAGQPFGGDSMVSAGGGGGLPNIDSPFEMGVALVVLAVIVWVGFKFFAD